MSVSTRFTGLLTQAWLHKGWLAHLLWPVSVVYGALMAARTWLYRHGVFAVHRCSVPVVVVGNVVVGGAGKTPVVIQVVRHLMRNGEVPGVISRGYGRYAEASDTDPVAVHALSAAAQVGDEPLLIHRATGAPVVVHSNRWRAAQALLAAHPNITVVVCDDGLQHLALAADVSIAVFDERGDGNGWLLPAGLLREPWPQRTGRPVDFVLHATPGSEPPARQLAMPVAHQPVFLARKELARHARNPAGDRVALSVLAGQPGAALAGIAKPEVFFNMLRQQGLALVQTQPLPDHHQPDEAFHCALTDQLTQCNVFMTEKDAVKLFPAPTARAAVGSGAHTPVAHASPPAPSANSLWAVPLELTIEPAFFAALDAKLSLLHGHQTA